MLSLDDLFFPKTIAIIGASANMLSFGSAFFTIALKELGYAGKVYYVNPKYEGEIINGEKVIKSLEGVEPIDVVYSCIRASMVPGLVHQCINRGDKFIVIFTSGFSEASEEGKILQEKLLVMIKESPTRIIGPNCLGPYNPSIGVGWNTGIDPPKEKGNVAFASQSGGHATMLLKIARGRGFYFSKGLSFGNQIDLNCQEVLDYYGKDPETEVIALYLEDVGSAKGNEFFRKMREITPKKPVILWKGGQTETGARAAVSHTGAMSGSFTIWNSMVKQAGGIFVENGEEFWDMLHFLAILIPHHKLRECKNLGLIIPGGGSSVEGTDIFTRAGFNVPVLTEETQAKIRTLIPDVNTSVKNPIDLGATGTLERVFLLSLKYVAEDPQIDIVIHYQPIDWIAETETHIGSGKGYASGVARSLGRLSRKLEKPLIQLCPILQLDEKIAEIYPKFIEILYKMGVPNFNSMPRLAKALLNLNEYMAFLKAYGKS